MKQLRILTGVHAGAQLLLDRRQYRVGSDEEADIQITDWRHASVELQLDDAGNVMLTTLRSPNPDPSAVAMRLENMVPQRFGEVVLCVGPAAARWPSDVALMSRLLRGGAAQRRKASSRRAIVGGGAACAVMLGIFVGVVDHSASRAQASTPQLSLTDKVRKAVAGEHVAGITVREAGEQVIVQGLLADAPEVSRLRAVLNPFDHERIAHKYAAASDLVQSISDALASPELRASYSGGGVFTVRGATLDKERLRASVQRIAADLGPLVERIDIAVSELPPPQRVHIGAMLVDDDLQYVQTGDGTKHLSQLPEAAPVR